MTGSSFPVIITDRLKLRKPLDTDVKSISLLRSDAAVNKFILKRGKHFSEQEAATFIKRIVAEIECGNCLYWIITEKEQSELIGTICLWKFSKNRKSAEVGYELMPQYQQQGIMTEALNAVINYSRKELNLFEIKACTNFRNTASLQLLRKAGFVYLPDEKDAESPEHVIYRQLL
jgi:ribosomal-protein-alanine N-acetyltransferase